MLENRLIHQWEKVKKRVQCSTLPRAATLNVAALYNNKNNNRPINSFELFSFGIHLGQVLGL